jgi:PAS domain-containing protein
MPYSKLVRSFAWNSYQNFLIPAAYLLITLMIDSRMPFSTVTPLFGITGLMVFAFSLRPRWMSFWALVYTLIVGFIFLNPSFVHSHHQLQSPQDQVTPYLQTITFALVATLATQLCINIQKLIRIGKSLRELLEKIPFPVITSDINGDIHYMNPEAQRLLGQGSEYLSLNYFNILSPPGHQGTLIAAYLRRFDGQDLETPFSISILGKPHLGEMHLLKETVPITAITILKSVS